MPMTIITTGWEQAQMQAPWTHYTSCLLLLIRNSTPPIGINQWRCTLDEFKSYIDQYHYLKFNRTVGENMKYTVRDRSGTPLACLLFGSAAWSCSDRDRFIGWDKTSRERNLQLLTNQTRFLIFPWVKVPCLASHLLSLASRRVVKDWEEKYGHGLAALETFVEVDRFYGTVYKAANWICVGRTTGRGRDGGHHHAVLPKKDIYLYPLRKDYREILQG